MIIQDFFRKFPDEESCRAHFKSERDRNGVTCKRCEHREHYWISTRDQYQCKKCSFRTTLRSGTLLHGSQLPYYYWYFAMMMLTGTKKSFSALEVQRQLGHRYYEPIWYMLHKIRYAMGKRDDLYKLRDEVELDEGFFETVPDKEGRDIIAKELKENDGKYKRGKGSQKQSKVLVMAESKTVPPTNKYRHKQKKKVGYIKMGLLEDLRKETTNEQVEKTIDQGSSATTDGATITTTSRKTLPATRPWSRRSKRRPRRSCRGSISPSRTPRGSCWTCTIPSAGNTCKAISTNSVTNSTGGISIRCSIG